MGGCVRACVRACVFTCHMNGVVDRVCDGLHTTRIKCDRRLHLCCRLLGHLSVLNTSV